MQRRIGVYTPVSHLPGVFELIKSKGDVYPLPRADRDTVYQHLHAGEIDTIICNPNQQSYRFDSDMLENSYVKTIVTCSTGLSHIDLEYCEEKGIEVLSLTDDLIVINQLPSTAELAFILMGNLLRKIPQATQHVINGGWNYEPFIGRQLAHLKIGIVGCGRLGKMMIHQCNGFMMDVCVYDPYRKCYIRGVNQVDSLEEMFAWADVVSLHVHLNDETKEMINTSLLTLPKKQFYLVNTSRGGIVNELAVHDALKSGMLTGYATDVLSTENTDNLTESPIIQSMVDGDNVIVTPHIGGMTWEGQEFAYKSAIKKL